MVWSRHRWFSLIISIALLFVLICTPAGTCRAQKSIARMPFSVANNLIILTARINGSDTLHFILDTGLKNSIICELENDETLDLEEAREIRVMGLGEGSPVEAIHSTIPVI